MDVILVANNTWQTSDALATDEIWQNKTYGKIVNVSKQAISANTDIQVGDFDELQGISLLQFDSIQFAAGDVVRYRSKGGVAVISREPV